MPSLELALLVAAKAAVILLVTAVVALLAHRASAAIRHLIWTTGLAATLVLPAVPLAVPRWPALPSFASIQTPVIESPAFTPVATPTVASSAIEPSVLTPSPSRPVTPVAVVTPALAPAETAASFSIDTWLDRLLGIWALGAALAGAWLVAGFAGLRRLTHTAVPLESPEWIESVEEVLADQSFRRPLRFLESASVPTPCTWGILRPVVLLPTAGADWSAAHRRHVVIHELAHVARFDCLTHLVARVACAIHWFNPLAWLAARSARMAREQACDDAVLNAGGRPSEYAGLLLEAAETGPFTATMPAAALAMARRSQLGDRLLAVLDPVRRRRGLDRGAIATAGFGALGLLVPLGAVTTRPDGTIDYVETPVVAATPTVAPTPAPVHHVVSVARAAQDPDRCRSDGHGTDRTFRMSSSTTITGEGSVTDDNGNRMVVWTGRDCAVSIRSRGTPSFTEAEDDLSALPRGGRFEITFERGNTERRYLVTNRNGNLERQYTIDGQAATLDPAAIRWRQSVILEFIRRSGFDAAARAARIWKTRGFDGFLKEVDEIESDGGRARYLEVALKTPAVTAAQAAALLQRTTTIESDGDQAQVLASIPLPLLSDQDVADGYLAAVRRIESDGDKTMVLKRLVRQRPPAATLGIVLGLAGTIESDGDRTSLLIATIDAYPGAANLPPAFYDAARGIESDGDLASLLIHALEASKVEPASCERFLGLTGAIESSGDRSAVLTRAAETVGRDAGCQETAIALAGDIDSDGDRAATLIHFIEGGTLAPASLGPLLKAVDGIESDGDKSSVLNRMTSGQNLSDALIAGVLRSARTIGSDGDRSSVLVRMARRGLIRTPALRQAYVAAAEEIGSDGDRQAALRAAGSRETER